MRKLPIIFENISKDKIELEDIIKTKLANGLLSKKNLLGVRLGNIINAVPSIDDVETKLSDVIIPLLSTIKLMDGYELASFKYGVDDFGYEYIPYVRRCNALTQWCPPEKTDYKSCIRKDRLVIGDYATGEYKDEYLIEGIWGYERDISSVPSILPYFELTFSEEGVLEAWILYNLRELLPRYWHANYGAKDFIYGIETIKLMNRQIELEGLDEMERNSIKDAVRSLDFNELAPHVTINGDTATFTCAYWNQFSGLYKMETIFERVGSHIHCVSQNKTCLVPHRSSIMY